MWLPGTFWECKRWGGVDAYHHHEKFLSRLLTAILPSVAAAEDTRLAKIAHEFEIREQADDSILAHTNWLKTEHGVRDVAFLAENFDQLPQLKKLEIPTELARTGLLVVVPLVKKSLTGSRMPLAGLFYACRVGKHEPGFGKAVAPSVVPWVGKNESKIATDDMAAQILAILDPELATRVLLEDRFLNINYPQVHWILKACNEGGLKVPLNKIEPLLAAWEVLAANPECDYRIERGFQEALKALAPHAPERAIEKAEQMIKLRPDWSEKLAELPLLAVGLSDLYYKLADVADDPARFAKLPKAAQHYFAVTYFEADCANGGISQALGNSTGDYFPIVVDAYRTIGDNRSLEWLAMMCQPFGKDGPPQERLKRNQQMDSMSPPYIEQIEKIEMQWKSRHPNVGWMPSTAWRLARYASQHAEEIRNALRRSVQ